MRIQSKFKDYYDFSLPYRETDERAYYWVRNQTQSLHDPCKFPKIASDDTGHPSTGLPTFKTEQFNVEPHRRLYVPMYVTLGGKTVAFYRDQQAIEKNAAEQAIALEADRPVDKDYVVYSTEPDFKLCKWKRRHWRTRKAIVSTSAPEIIDTVLYPQLVALQMEHQTPTLMMTLFGDAKHPVQIELVVNPRLLDYGIQHVFPDAQQMYQELEMWFTDGKFDRDPVGNPEQTNIEKVVSHGFDKKKSFRNMPRD